MIRPCSEASCPNPAVIKGRCGRHAKQREQQRNQDRQAQRSIYNSKRWRITRRKQLFAQPLCAQCGRVAQDVHHIQDLGQGGNPWHPSNLMSLCHQCHSHITRGRQAA